MSRDDVPMFRRKRETPRLKFEVCDGMFLVIPTIVIDRRGIALAWLFWAVAFDWSK